MSHFLCSFIILWIFLNTFHNFLLLVYLFIHICHIARQNYGVFWNIKLSRYFHIMAFNRFQAWNMQNVSNLFPNFLHFQLIFWPMWKQWLKMKRFTFLNLEIVFPRCMSSHINKDTFVTFHWTTEWWYCLSYEIVKISSYHVILKKFKLI